MSIDYVELAIDCNEVWAEALGALLGPLGFEAFEQVPSGLLAYAPQSAFNAQQVEQALQELGTDVVQGWRINNVPRQNWNQEWEKHYDPIELGQQVYVRASFHAPKPGVPHEIVIDPKMSFGTGHHATTYLMLEHLLGMDLRGKSTFDIGCGTGILAIMAAQKGAQPVQACDVDPWCVENSAENLQLNQLPHISVQLGTFEQVVAPNKGYDVLIANINRNVLLQEMPVYVRHLNPGGHLLLSGFYEQDVPALQASVQPFGLALSHRTQRQNWASLHFTLAK